MISLLICTVLAAAPEPPRYLLAVGHNRGQPLEKELRYAEYDSERFAEVMRQYGGVTSHRSRVLKGPTVDQTLAALDELVASATTSGRKDSVLLFYYSGHADETDLHLGSERFSRARLERNLAQWPGRLRVVVIDACRGQGTNDKGFQKIPHFSLSIERQEIEGIVTLSSSSSGEASQESDQLGGAIYTHYLLNGLRGAADSNLDHRVSLEEAYLYAYDQTVRRSAAGPGSVMHPSIKMDIKGAGALILTQMLELTSVLILPQEDALYLLYHKTSGRLIAELASNPERPTRLGIGPGAYLLQRRVGKRGWALELSVQTGESIEVTPSDFVYMPFELLVAKGGAVKIWRHDLSVHGGGLVSHQGTVGFHTRLKYMVGWSAWRAGVTLGIGRFAFVGPSYETTESWLGGEFRLLRERLFGAFDLGIGVAWRVVDQKLAHRQEGLLNMANFSGREHLMGLALGPSLSFEWRAFLAGPTFFEVGLVGLGFFRREEGGVQLRPELSAELGFGVRL